MFHKLIFKNTFYQIINRFITSAIGFLITILIAKYFGVLGYGEFTKVITFAGIFYLVADFGLNAIYLQKEENENNFSNLLFLRFFISILLIIFINIITFFLPFNSSLNLGFSESVKIGIAIFSLTILTQAFQFCSAAVFQKKLKFDLLIKSGAAGSLVTVLLVGASIVFSFPFYFIFISFVIGGIVSSFLSLYLTYKKIIFSLDFSFMKNLFLESMPLGFMLIFNLIYFRIDVLLLSFFKTTADVGIYGFSYKFFDFLVALPLFLSNSIYPLLISWQKNHRTLMKFSRNYFFVFLFASLFLVIIFWFIAPLISLVRQDFFPSILPLRILLLSLPFFFLTSFMQWILISQGKQKILMLIYLFSAVINVLLNVIYIPKYSYIASAIITGVSEAIVFVLLCIVIQVVVKNTQSLEQI
ncbi:hypothetical protein C4559_01495 [Candidatus Microgenomates bacterium]|nr:MAG: hypothetical protein C4559_01495 [Candidatus Microgenomates bacterium]